MNRIYLFIYLFLLVGCSHNLPGEKLTAKGGKNYGGEFRFMSLEKVNYLFPLHSMDLYSQRINTHIYESLFREDPNGNKVIPHLIDKYTISSDELTYHFELKKGIYFHEDPCFGKKTRELSAEDIKYLLEFACSSNSLNHLSHLLVGKIKGSEEHFIDTKKNRKGSGIQGVKIHDARKFSVTLTKPYANFIKLLSHPSLCVFPKEAFEKYGSAILTHPVGTGPFMLEKMDSEGIRLKRNNNYWQFDEFGNRLPFLNGIVMKYGKDKNSELSAFKNNQIDLILEVPVENVTNLLGTLKDAQSGNTIKHKVLSRRSSMMNYLVFSSSQKPFDDVRVRKAFLYAINRESITNEILLGEGYPAKHGFIPEMFGFVPDSSYKIPFDIQKAKDLLAEAGYPNGANFPETSLWVNTVEGSSTYLWTNDVINQLKYNLNVNLNIKLCSFKERQEAIKKGEATFWRSGWIPDYADPESFMSIFYKPYIEVNPFLGSVYSSNTNFNELYQASLLEKELAERNRLLNRCNKILIEDALIVPVFSNDFFAVLNLKIRDFIVNSIETMDLSKVYIKDIK